MAKYYSMVILLLVSMLVACTAMERITPAPIESFPVVSAAPIDQQPPAPKSTLAEQNSPQATAVPVATQTSTPQPADISSWRWTPISNGNYVRSLCIDQFGNVWSVGNGGVVRWTLQTGAYTKYTTVDGLADDDVTSVAQTKDGAMWFGTNGRGLSRFDGKNWKTYTDLDPLTNNYIVSLAASPTGGLWVGTGTAIAYYDGTTWTAYRPASGYTKADVISVATDGSVWVGGRSLGVYRFDGKQWTDFRKAVGLTIVGEDADDYVTTLTAGPDGSIWVATNRFLYRYDGQHWTHFRPWKEADSVGVGSIAVALDGKVWVGFSTLAYQTYFGVYQFDGKDWKLFSTADGLASNQVPAIAIARDQSVWFGTYDQGLSRFDGQQWKTFHTNDTLLDNDVLTLAVSPQGEVWAGFPQGAGHWDGQHWTNHLLNNDLSSGVSVIHFNPDGSVVAGGLQGLAWWDGQIWTTYSWKKYDWFASVHAIASLLDDTTMVGSSKGMVRFQGKDLENLQGIEISDVNVILADSHGTLWLGTNDGLYTYQGNRLNEVPFPSLNQPEFLSGAIGSDQELWFGTDDGVVRFDGQQWKTFSYSAQEIPYGIINDIAVDPQGIVWAACNIGLLRYNGQEWRLITSQDGLSDYYVRSVAVGPDGAIWVATNAGISRFSPVPSK